MTDEDKKPKEENKVAEAKDEEKVKAEDDKKEDEKTKGEDKKPAFLKDDEKEKAFQTSIKTGLDGLSEQLTKFAEHLQGIDSRIKALETPTDLPAAPAGTTGSDNDVGADITVPAQPYPQGDQAGLDDDRQNENAPAGDSAPSMQEKPLHKSGLVSKSQHTFTTETPRPGAAIEKAGESQTDFSPILKDARAEGYEGLSSVARNILKGKYYTPTQDEVAGF
jgi:hypothetical protein